MYIPKTIDLQENIGENLCDPSQSQIILDATPKVLTMKKNRLNLINIKNFFSLKALLKK